jgi:hypothetical protein
MKEKCYVTTRMKKEQKKTIQKQWLQLSKYLCIVHKKTHTQLIIIIRKLVAVNFSEVEHLSNRKSV